MYQFSYSEQQTMSFVLVINFKMPTFVLVTNFEMPTFVLVINFKMPTIVPAKK